MFLIMSAAYVGQELVSEFGKIPPSFLPLGNRRLFHHQVALAPEGVKILLSIPENFEVSSIDGAWLIERGVTILRVPERLSLGASLVAALNISGFSLDKPLHVLYGDTLFKSLPKGDDFASVSVAKGSYNWAALTTDTVNWIQDCESNQNSCQRVIDGYFKFSNPRHLIKNITQSEWSYIEGLNRYHIDIGLSAVVSNGWLDFGHVNTYYNSKAEYTTQRAFNELIITPNWIEKSSYKSCKITAEAHWFSSLPYDLRGYIPQYLGSENIEGKVSYRLEYMHLTALNELFVFSKLPTNTWKKILSDCFDFLIACKETVSEEKLNDNNLESLFTKKTTSRLKLYCDKHKFGLDDVWRYNKGEAITLREVLVDSQTNLPKSSYEQTVLHGDFCFSNILYDFRAGKVKVIDPRGLTSSGNMTIYGDLSYDIAKISHSILGMYDWIVAGYYDVDIQNGDILFEVAEENEHKETQQAFIELVEEKFQLTQSNLYAMQIQLFLSMLPLHDDDPKRQKALFANAFRLHSILTRLSQ